MHYCFLTTGTWDGNASFVRLREFGRELIARGIAVSYIVDDLPFNRNSLSLAGEMHFTPPGGLISQTLARRRMISTLTPDFVHVLNPFVKAFLSLAFSSQRVVGDWDEWPAARQHPFPKNAIEKFLDRWLRRRANVHVVASRFLQSEFSKLSVDAAYIPYATYLPQHDDGASPFAEPTAAYVGNFYAAYDHDLIFEAAKILQSRESSFHIAMLGGGPDLEKWREFVRTNHLEKSVFLPGFVSGGDLWRHLRHAQVLLLPIRDTLLNRVRCPSKTFAYAQSMRPTIANRVGEVAQVLGEKANYVEPSPTAFADAIERALASPGLPDIDYNVESQNWSVRTEALLAALSRAR